MEFILESDIPYEQEILKAPEDIVPWFRYLFHKRDRPLSEQSSVYERAVRIFPRSYKLWKAYLDLRVNHVKRLNPSSNESEFQRVNYCFQRALVLLNKMPRIWTDYLEFLMLQSNVTMTRKAFDSALQSVSVYQHFRIWPLFIKFATTIANDDTCVHIFKRYLCIQPREIETYIELLTERGFYDETAHYLIKVLDDPDFVSVQGKSRFQLWSDLAEILIYHPEETANWPTETILRSGIQRYPDQRGRLWVYLATYFINKGGIEKARDVFEEGMVTAMTVKDFSLVFDSYAEMEEVNLSRFVEKGDPALDSEIDRLMSSFEQLMNRRTFLVSDVLLRQDPNNVVEWEKRVALWTGNEEKMVQTYAEALETIKPHKANGRLYKLWTNYAKFYEQRDQLDWSRVIFEKATRVPFKSVNELVEIYIEWAEMELRAEEFERAMNLLEKSTKPPKINPSKVDFFDESVAPQERLFKSMKLWSFYVDLLESVASEDDPSSIEDVKKAYDTIFHLKIGTPLTIVNYASFLWDLDRFEEAFKVYERGVDLFSYPVAFEIWNIYLQKAIERNLGMERLRDLFEQALEGCPNKLSKPIFVLFGKLEEDRGLVRNAMKIYDRASHVVPDKDKLEMYKYYIARTIENFGLASTRPIFERAINALPESDAKEACLEFITVELKLGEVDRARALYGYGSQFCDPRTSPEYWTKWHDFELEYGNEDTYKEMLRIKRSVIAQFNTDIGYLAAQAVALKNQTLQQKDQQDSTKSSLQAAAAPVGFVLGKDTQKKKAPEEDKMEVELPEANPEEIDIDIDL